MTSLSLYPMKYLIDLFVPYGSFLETNIFLTSTPSILNSFLFLQKRFFDIFVVVNYVLSTHSLDTPDEKKFNFF